MSLMKNILLIFKIEMEKEFRFVLFVVTFKISGVLGTFQKFYFYSDIFKYNSIYKIKFTMVIYLYMR